IQINLAHIFFKRAQLLGVGSVSRSQLSDVSEMTARGLLRSHVDKILPLEEVVVAHELMEAGKVSGRVILAMNAGRN
ncbi:MAG: zinc-binding dehydrogenase, partial [Xanthobacteraceae bacterium]